MSTWRRALLIALLAIVSTAAAACSSTPTSGSAADLDFPLTSGTFSFDVRPDDAEATIELELINASSEPITVTDVQWNGEESFRLTPAGFLPVEAGELTPQNGYELVDSITVAPLAVDGRVNLFAGFAIDCAQPAPVSGDVDFENTTTNTRQPISEFAIAKPSGPDGRWTDDVYQGVCNPDE